MAVAASPLAMLLAPATGAPTIPAMGSAAAAITLCLVAFLRAVPFSRHRPLPWLFLITALVVASDVLLGCHLISRSPLSGYAVAGIRFYGLGNEYTGVLVGTSLLGALAFEPHLRRFRWLQAVFFLVLLLLIGSPVHGADLGGALAAAAGFGAALAAATRSRRPMRAVAVVAASWASGIMAPAAGCSHC
jgi:hypothetical protein